MKSNCEWLIVWYLADDVGKHLQVVTVSASVTSLAWDKFLIICIPFISDRILLMLIFIASCDQLKLVQKGIRKEIDSQANNITKTVKAINEDFCDKMLCMFYGERTSKKHVACRKNVKWDKKLIGNDFEVSFKTFNRFIQSAPKINISSSSRHPRRASF